MADRTVHARTASGAEVVRYDRAGKWYAETADTRRPIRFAEAVELAALWESQVTLGLSGGRSFDAAVAPILLSRLRASSLHR